MSCSVEGVAAAVVEDVDDWNSLNAGPPACYRSAAATDVEDDDRDRDQHCLSGRHAVVVVVAATKRVAEHVVVAVVQHAAHGNPADHFLLTCLNHYCYRDEAEPAVLFQHSDRETDQRLHLRLYFGPVDSQQSSEFRSG